MVYASIVNRNGTVKGWFDNDCRETFQVSRGNWRMNSIVQVRRTIC